MGGDATPPTLRAAILFGSVAPALVGGWLLGRARPLVAE